MRRVKERLARLAQVLSELVGTEHQNIPLLPPEGIPLAMHYLEHVQDQGMTPEEYQAQFPLHCRRLSEMLAPHEATPSMVGTNHETQPASRFLRPARETGK